MLKKGHINEGYSEEEKDFIIHIFDTFKLEMSFTDSNFFNKPIPNYGPWNYRISKILKLFNIPENEQKIFEILYNKYGYGFLF
jgi:hypothetical protein